MKTTNGVRFALTASLVVTLLGIGCANNTEPKVTVIVPTNAPPPPVAVTVAEPVRQVPPAIPQTTPGVAELVKLAQANVEESVILAYVETSPIPFEPTADEIVYLNDVGISSRVVSAMIEHGRRLRSGQVAAAAPSQLTSVITLTNNPADPLAPQVLLTNDALPAATTPAATTVVLAPSVPATVATAAPAAATANVFYDSLAPYGTWMDVPDYGWVWQPSVVTINSDWQPYWDGGRWVYSDAGWYWTSDYSWGWAPFHYGRWFRHSSRGWLWVPDTVWGPSWVSWRRTPLYCGWAPLPPCAVYEYGRGFTYYGATVGSDCDFGLTIGSFGFVHYQYFCGPHPRGHRIHGPNADRIFHDSTVANHYYLGPNRAIINGGIDRDHVAKFNRNEIRKVSIRDLPPAEGKYVKPDRIERNGSSLVVYRPEIQKGAPPSATAPLGIAASPRGRDRSPTPTPTPGYREPSPTQGPPSRAAQETANVRPESRPASPSSSLGPGRATPPVASGNRPNPAAMGNNLANSPAPRATPLATPATSTTRTFNRLEAEKPAPSPYKPRFSVSDPRGANSAGGGTDASTPTYGRSINGPPVASTPASTPAVNPRLTPYRQETPSANIPRPRTGVGSSGGSFSPPPTASTPASSYRPSPASTPLATPASRSTSGNFGGGTRTITPAATRSFGGERTFSAPSMPGPSMSTPSSGRSFSGGSGLPAASGGGVSAPAPRAAPPTPTVTIQPSSSRRSEPTPTVGGDPRKRNN